MIACISLYNTNYTPLAKLTLDENRLEYCETHGYLPSFHEFEDIPGATYPEIFKRLGFIKLELILQAFEKHPHCEWVWFADCDGMVTNMKFDLEDFLKAFPHQGLLLSSDCHGLNAGSILVKNEPWVKAYFKGILDQKDGREWRHEQDAYNDTLHEHTTQEILVLPQQIMNAYDYQLYPDAKPVSGFEDLVTKGQWAPGNFFIHWPGRTLEQRIAHYHDYEKEVVR